MESHSVFCETSLRLESIEMISYWNETTCCVHQPVAGMWPLLSATSALNFVVEPLLLKAQTAPTQQWSGFGQRRLLQDPRKASQCSVTVTGATATWKVNVCFEFCQQWCTKQPLPNSTFNVRPVCAGPQHSQLDATSGITACPKLTRAMQHSRTCSRGYSKPAARSASVA